MLSGKFGAPARRIEDPRLLRGLGSFVDDIDPPGVLHAAILRSPYGHARFAHIDTTAARAVAGVHAVYTAADLGEFNRPAPLAAPHPNLTHGRTQRPLAEGKVCFIGEAVAMVVADNRYVAEDAVGLIEVDWDPRAAVVDFRVANRADQPLVHDDVPNNIAARFLQTVGDPDDAFSRAAHVYEESVYIERSCGSPIEARGVVAVFDPLQQALTVWDATQAPLTIKNGLANMLGLPEFNVEVIAPDVGGSFGAKIMTFFPEEVLVPWAAVQLHRPVKWTEDRREHFISANQERGQAHTARVAVDAEGHILAVESTFTHDTGAYTPCGMVVPIITATQLPGPYKVPNYRSDFTVVYTNTPCVSPYRGAGRPHACFVMERLIDRIARELQLEPNEVRRRNFVQPNEFPWDVGLPFRDGAPTRYDSGNYAAGLALAEEMVDIAAFRAEQAAARASGRYLGLGFAAYVEGTKIGPYEGAHVRIEPSGRVLAATGVAPERATWVSGQHAAIVEVNPSTGDLRFLRYVVVHDCGVLINPTIVEGQIHGGVAQGIGGAFYERLHFDDSGQLVNASFMDFLMPTAVEVPFIEVAHIETPSPLNPLGVKGVGEAGTIPVAACVAEAVEDALTPFGVRVHEMPLSPVRIRELIDEAVRQAK